MHAIADAVTRRVFARERDRFGLMSVAKTSTCGAATAIEHADHARSVPTSATRVLAVDVGDRRVDEASVVARGVKTRPGAVRNSSPWKVVSMTIGLWLTGRGTSGARWNVTVTASRGFPDADDADARQRQLTRMGNAAAGAGLALVLQGGTREAREWFAMAAGQGNGEGARRLGELYAAGDGGKADKGKALEWWNKADQAGDPTYNAAPSATTPPRSRTRCCRSGTACASRPTRSNP